MEENWATLWVADKLRANPDITAIDLTSSGLLQISRKDHPSFKAAALGVEDMVMEAHVVPFFVGAERPQFVINVPSKAIWTGPAIELVHSGPAAFGGMGDLSRASSQERVSSYRFRNYQFVEEGLRQHSAVRQVTRLYDRMFMVARYGLPDLTIVLVDAYEMSAENVRSARKRYDRFDVALKTTSYGGVTTAAKEAAASMGAVALLWRDLMGRLHQL
jgi:hypothetical protein